MTRGQLVSQIKEKKSFLCVGLDSDIKKLPAYLLGLPDPVFEFNKQIIDNTYKFAVAYKPNVAFYEAMGPRGWESLQKTLDYIPAECFTIADAKRGDIGNTSNLYARTFFDKESSGFDFDSVTVAPYMGQDSVEPFFQFKDKWVIVLALTSNTGSADFQMIQSRDGEFFYEKVIKACQNWGNESNLMFVVGATKAESLQRIRSLAPKHFLLVPGVGAQGGSLSEVAKYGMNADCGLLVNSSREIIFASSDSDFGQKAGTRALEIQREMEILLDQYMV